MKADPERDEICVDGVPISREPEPEKIYLMLNKPRGYVTTLSDEKGRPSVAALVADCGVRVWPVGRLDMYSEGLLLFTNDGDFTHTLLHPSHEVEKEYLVRVKPWSRDALEVLTGPIALDGHALAPAKVRLLKQEGDAALISVTIHEGRNRQIRRMCDLAGLQVLRLKRIREDTLTLGDLPVGKWRRLTLQEVADLSPAKIKMQDTL